MRVTKEREKKGWSKGELSRRSGVGLSEISRIEAGKLFPYPGWRRKIADALGKPEEVLFPEYCTKKEV
ncbi:MAG: helix-turn-helix transcriptional regulator [Peptococcaceae bacterium]|jgi:transcriptional regulator with XRE-family HTH domain|nr:helix-turn-helix transcriptional regulator [Peptococcaceae bacterium]MDH7525704.1 helix-turn-helix transcriptional regulator [Peptococcaceae bacterium]